MLVYGRAQGLGGRGHPAVPVARKGADVGAEMDRLGPDLGRQLRDLDLRSTTADDEMAAAGAQRAIEVLQALEQELCAWPGRVAAVEQAVVEAEHRHELLGAQARGLERRVVVDPQVAPQPQDARHASNSLTAAYRKAKIRARSRSTNAAWAPSPSHPSGSA